jgi:hypothetical protein
MTLRRLWAFLTLTTMALIPLIACSGDSEGPTEPPDTQPPTIAIQAPTSDPTFLTNATPITVSGTASDNKSVARVEWSVAGGPSGTATGTTSWSASIPLSEGANAITVTAVDGADNRASAQISITLDSGAPTVIITAPAGDTLTGESAINLAGTAADDGTIVRVAWSTNRGQSGTADGTTSWTIQGLTLLSGENVITVTADDEAGNTGNASVTVTLDDEDPSLSLVAPVPDGMLAVTQATVAVSGTADDNIGLDRVEWSTDQGQSGTATGTEEWQIPSLPLALGTNVLTVTVYDLVGNTASASLTFTRYQQAGSMALNPGAILVGSSSPIQVNFNLGAGVTVGPQGVRLALVDERNALLEEVAELFDDGDLTLHGDEILGDGVYSNRVVITESAPGTLRLMVLVDLGDEAQGRSPVTLLPIHTPASQTEHGVVLATQTSAGQKLDSLLAQGASLEAAVAQLATFLSQQEGVASVQSDGVTSIEIRYTSGLLGGLMLQQTNAGGSVITRGGGALTATAGPPTFPHEGLTRWTAQDTVRRAAGPTIPLHLQTTGTSFGPDDLALAPAMSASVPKDVILSQKVLIYAPYEADWDPFNEGPALVTALNNSALDFSITYLRNQQATVAALQGMTQYGLVVLATHGSGGEWILTGQVATAQGNQTYAALLKDGQLGTFTNITIGTTGSTATTKATVYAATSKFVANLPGTFPQSLVVNNSCESTKTAKLSSAFLAKGAQTYFGHSEIVMSGFAVDRVVELIGGMLVEGLPPVKDVFVPGQVDPPYGAVWQFVGNEELRFSDDFINGDFEFGNLQGWTTLGDGRVITRLGFLDPYEGSFMGIISTGLGFTETSGAIYQSFTVADTVNSITLNWNFLSEEFLEFIGSQFQDFFRISITDGSGATTVLFSRTVDQIAAAFQCTDEGGPNCSLIPVSPGIVFDQGDVWMTGWQTLTLNLAPYRGQTVTIKFEAGDVGDSIYDTAVLLDGMVVQ